MSHFPDASAARLYLAPDGAAGGAVAAPQPGAAPDPDEPTLDLIASKIKGGQCILFLGSGVHRPPTPGIPYVYPPEQCPPVGPAL